MIRHLSRVILGTECLADEVIKFWVAETLFFNDPQSQPVQRRTQVHRVYDKTHHPKRVSVSVRFPRTGSLRSSADLMCLLDDSCCHDAQRFDAYPVAEVTKAFAGVVVLFEMDEHGSQRGDDLASWDLVFIKFRHSIAEQVPA